MAGQQDSNSNDATRSRTIHLHSPVRFWRTKGWFGWRESPEDLAVHDRCPRNLHTSWTDNTKSSWLCQGTVLKIPNVIPTCSWVWEAVPHGVSPAWMILKSTGHPVKRQGLMPWAWLRDWKFFLFFFLFLLPWSSFITRFTLLKYNSEF